MKRVTLLILFLISFSAVVNAQNATKYSNEFLNLGVGARAMGMSNSIIGLSDDVYSGYWNPAGLTGINDKIQAAFMHNAYFANMANYDYLSFATKPNDNSALGISIIRFGVDGILNTLDLIQNGEINYDRITQFSAVDYAFMLHYAQNVELNSFRRFDFMRDAELSWGVNTKIINRKAGPFATAWGFGFDAGARLTGLKYGWSFGFMARDVTTTFNSWRYSFTEKDKEVLLQTGNEIPINTLELTLPKFIFGAGKKWDTDRLEFYTAFDFDLTTDGMRNTLIKSNLVSVDPRIGGEVSYKLNDESNRISLRMGVGNFQKETKSNGKFTTTFMPTVGIGIRIKNFSIDYALTDVGDQSSALYSNVISLKFGFDAVSQVKR